jgi:hypothetical protein
VQLINDRVLVPKPINVAELFGFRIHDQPPGPREADGAYQRAHCRDNGAGVSARP